VPAEVEPLLRPPLHAPDYRQNGRPNQQAAALARDISPIDWRSFWATDVPAEEWTIEPIVPKGRQVAIYSPPKGGKSLFALDAVAALSTGRSVLGQPARLARSVVYLDFEMTEDDVRERLVDLGYGPDDDLSRLAYYQLPSLPPLDTERGGRVLEEIIARHNPELVIIDTMARVVQGDENDAGTYTGFYAHSGIRLKRRGVGLLRLDHAGKDVNKGQRGSSGKADDVDCVFRLSLVEDKILLTRTHSRIPWVPAQVTLRRESDPVLRHVLVDGGWPAGTKATAESLDELGVPLDATLATAVRALKMAGKPRRRQVVGAGLRFRKLRSGTVPDSSGTARNHACQEQLGTVGNFNEGMLVSLGGAVPGTVGNRALSTTGTQFPSLEGTDSGTGPDEQDEEPW